MDLLYIFLIGLFFFVLFGFMAVLAAMILFHQELSFIPRRYYNVRLFNKDQRTDESLFNRATKGWIVKRKGVKYLRIELGFLNGVDLDIGFMRHVSQLQDPKGKTISSIDLLEKIPGVKDESNFEPLILPYEPEPQIERNMRAAAISLTELSQKLKLANLKDADEGQLNEIRNGMTQVKDELTSNIDKILDRDRRIQAAQISGWSEFQASGIEKSAWRVQKEDILLKYAPWIGLFAVMMLAFFVVLMMSDYATNSIKDGAQPVVAACTAASNNYIEMARACGYTPPVQNVSITQTEPPGLNLPW